MKFRNLKRAITLLLVFTITFSCVQWPGTFTSEYLRAAAVESFDENDSYVSDELQIKSTNSFGDLLTTTLKDKFDEQSGENSDFCVYSVEIKDNSAIVSYTSLFDCNLTVAIYDNDGRKMYTSASTKVKSSENETKIEIQDVLPEYYLVKAYLTMSDSLAPLCQVYENNTYTEHMQSFLSKTISDFEEDRVLCLDEEATSNFAVFSEDVIVIENETGYNTVSSCDNENGVYIIENINKTVASLQPGDVLAYNYNNINDMIIVKIDTIDITENTATIRAAETSIEEVFDHLRYEVDDAMEHANFDTNGIPNVLYSNFDDLNDYTIEETARVNTPSQIVETSSKLNALPNPMKNTSKPESKLEFDATLDVDTDNDSVTGTGSITATIAFSPNLDEFDTSKTIKTPYGELPAAKTNVAINTSFTGSATVTLKASIKIYFAKDDDNNEATKNRYVEVKFINKTEFYADFDTSINISIPLWNTYFPYYGFCIEFTPKIVINTTGKAEVSAVFTSTKGVEFKNGQMKRINPKGEVDIKFNGEVTVTVKLDIGPKCYFISEKLATVDTEFSFGIRVNAKLELEKEYSYEEDSENGTVVIEDKIDKHDCSTLLTEGDCGCIKGTVTGVGAVAGEIKFLNSSSFKLNLLKAELHLLDFYYSLKYNEFGKGICPHKFYYYELNINDINGDKIEDAEVYVSEKPYKTDKNGRVLVYLSPGENKVKINKENYKEEELTLELTSSYNTKYKNDSGLGFNEKVESESTTTANKSDSPTTQTTVSTKKLNVNVDLDIADISYDIEETVKINGDEKRSDIIVLKPEPHEVAVKVVDENGSPVKGVKIESDYEYAEIDLLNTTNANGIKKLELPNGEWTITASKKGYTSVSETVTVEGDDTEITITIIGNSCTFTVTDQYGDPVNGAKLNFTNTQTGKKVFLISPTTDENGLYTYFFDVGEYEFTATKKGYDDCSGTFTVSEGDAEVDVEMYCDYKVVTVTAVDADGSSVEGAVISHDFNSSTYVTDSDGFVEVMLPVGDYTLEAKTEALAGTANVSVPDSDEPTEVVITMETFASGTCGKNVYWTLIGNTLRIYGEGEMYDWSSSSVAPWCSNCSVIEKVIIENNVTSIGKCSFNNCYYLTDIIIPDSVTRIGARAFYDCDALTSITLPDSVTSIGKLAFYDCNSLTSITIPDSVTSIGDNAFAECSALTSITIPDSVTSIGINPFMGTALLNNQTGVEYADTWVVECNFRITSVKIKEGTRGIGTSVFSRCYALTSITLPDSVTSIGDYAFSDCDALTDVYYTGTEEQWNAITIGSSNSDLTTAIIHYNSPPEETAMSSYTMRKTPMVKLMSEETMEATPTTTASSTTSTATTTSDTITTTTAKTATFTNLDPDRIYNFYSVKSREADDILSADNLIYVSQGMADENGYVDFEYSLDANTEEIVEFVVGMIYCIEYADVAIKDMEYTGSELTPEIAITYDGKTLEEDKDYTLSGILKASKPGLYKVKVSGVGDYYGEKYVDYAINCEHKYADGICATCGTQCVHTYENGLCSECGDTLHITTTISTTVSTTTTSTTITSTTTTSTTSTTSTTTLITTTTTSTTTSTNTTTTTTSTTSSNTTETVTTTSITNPSMTTEITQAQVYDELINKANKILEETGTTPIDIYGFVSNNNKYRYIEETRTLDEIESKGWAYYANYAINNRYVVQYYFAAITELLFQCAGYESRIVYGTGRGTGDHYWNQILIGGEWINYDACNGYYEVDDDYLKKQNYTYKEYLYPRFVPTIESEYLLGDVNNDGSVDSSDASIVLAEYAKIQTGGAGEFTETQHKAADVNNDGVVDSSDASKILAYYAMISTGKEPTWD